MNAVTNLATDEPVLATAIVQAAIALALAFGVKVTVSQIGAIVAFVGVLSAVLVRYHVTPFLPVVTTPTAAPTTKARAKR